MCVCLHACLHLCDSLCMFVCESMCTFVCVCIYDIISYILITLKSSQLSHSTCLVVSLDFPPHMPSGFAIIRAVVRSVGDPHKCVLVSNERLEEYNLLHAGLTKALASVLCSSPS